MKTFLYLQGNFIGDKEKELRNRNPSKNQVAQLPDFPHGPRKYSLLFLAIDYIAKMDFFNVTFLPSLL